MKHFYSDRAIVSGLYMETLFSSRAIVNDPTLEWSQLSGDCERHVNKKKLSRIQVFILQK